MLKGYVCLICSEFLFILYYVFIGDDVEWLSYLVEIEVDVVSDM